jgi:predicted 2-oxoglutarate/Fe(II)-dependent dioxygenase YbiX
VEKEELDGERIFLLHNFLSPEECDHFIARTEEVGYEDAPITTAGGFVMRKDIRDNDRVMLDDEELARQLFERARPLLPATWFGWELCGFNERFRFYRYGPGQRFAPHTDGYYERPNGERSHLTFMVYLNEGFEGGATLFERWGDSLDVVPRAGMALVFYHKLVHEGTEVLKGRKYVLRTDVMYRRASSNK